MSAASKAAPPKGQPKKAAAKAVPVAPALGFRTIAVELRRQIAAFAQT